MALTSTCVRNPSPRAITAQAMRAVLLAKATATTLKGFLARSACAQTLDVDPSVFA